MLRLSNLQWRSSGRMQALQAQAMRQGRGESSLMKTYLVYVDGNEVGMIKAGSHNAAEKKAQAKYPGKQVSVAYTEV
jgi:hypothetical protein